MAISKCKECGADISTDAKVCPSCGTTKPHKTNYKKMFIIGGIVLVLFTVWDISRKSKESPASDLSTETTVGEAPIFTKLEAAVYSAILYDDLRILVDGGDSFILSSGVLSNTPIIISSKKLQSEYEKNEVAADQQYKGKLISVSGTVKSIDKSFGNTILIGLNGGQNPFIYPRAIMSGGYENWVGNLKKGDDIGMVCTVNGMTVGSASIGNCIPSYDWANNTMNEIIKNTEDGFKNNNDFFVKIVNVTKKASSLLKKDSKCLSENSHNECMEEINTALEAASKNK